MNAAAAAEKAVERNIEESDSLVAAGDFLGVKPYHSSLEYLSDQFSILTLQIQISREHLKRELKEHITEEPSTFSWDSEKHAKRANVHEFEAKMRLIRTRMARRLDLSLKQGTTGLPRLEALCEKLKLDDFEKTVCLQRPSDSMSV